MRDNIGAEAVVNVLQFKEMLGNASSELEKKALNHAQDYYRQNVHTSVPEQMRLDDI